MKYMSVAHALSEFVPHDETQEKIRAYLQRHAGVFDQAYTMYGLLRDSKYIPLIRQLHLPDWITSRDQVVARIEREYGMFPKQSHEPAD